MLLKIQTYAAGFFLLFATGMASGAVRVPTETEKTLAAAIAAAPSPADAATVHSAEWSPGLAAAVVREGVSRESKDPAASEALYRLGEEIASRTGDRDTEANAMGELGAVLSRRLAFSESVPLLRRALDIQASEGHAALEDVKAAAETAVSLSLALVNSGQVEAALATSAQAVELARASGDELLLGRAWSASGSAATYSGNYREAIRFLQQALAIAEKQKSLAGQAAVLNNLGNASRRMFDFEAAAGYFQRSLDIKRQQPNARLASSLDNLGELAMAQDHFDEAERYFRMALDSVRSPQDDDIHMAALTNLGLVAQSRREFSKSLEYLDQGIALAEKAADAGSLVLSHLFEAAVYVQLHRPTEAQKHISLVREIAIDAGDRRAFMRLMMAQGDIFREQGEIGKARAEYKKALAEYETLRLNVAGDESAQADYADNSRYVYTSLIELEASAGKNDDAFHYAELSKSRVLLDDFTSGRAEMTRLLTEPEARRNSEMLARLSDLNVRLRSARGAERKPVAAEIDKLRFDYAAFRTGIYAAHPELALRRSDPEPVAVAQAAKLLPDEHTALVSYSVGGNAAYAFVITRIAGRPAMRVHELKTDEAKLASQVSKLRTQIAGRELGFTAAARELYDTLLKPIESEVGRSGKIDRLIVSPDAALWQIPFEALQDAAGKFVAENYEIFYVPSVTVLDRMLTASRGLKGSLSVLALGNPTGDLPEAAAEANNIGKLYAAGRSKVLTGAAASEAALRDNAGRYSVIHIAAHGKYDDAKPLYSYLALAATPAGSKTAADDGNLEAREIMDLHLTARLVILSGCETARSSGSGMGIAGMSWALFIAGAPATVASLWKVDSKSTAELMTGLHRGLARGETAAKALREAKLDLLRNPAYRHPFYWAGFIGIGAGT